MKKKLLLFLLISQVLIAGKTFAQNIAINSSGSTPDTSAMLDVSSTVKGFLAPRMTTTERNAIPLPATGLLIYNTTTSAFNVNVGTSASPSWSAIASGSTTVSNTSSTNSLTTTVNGVTGSSVSLINSNTLSLSGTNLTATLNGVASNALDLSGVTGTSAWMKTGNNSITAAHYIGTTNNASLRFRTYGTEKMVLDSNGRLGIGTIAPEADLTIFQNSGTAGSTKGIRFTGNSIGGTSSGTGFGMSLGYNIANNKQLWLGDADYLSSNSGTFVRLSASNGFCIIDGVAGDNSVRRPINIGVSGDPNSAVVLGADLSNTAPSSYIWGNGNMAIGAGYKANAAPTNGLLVQGNVGIGTPSPGSALDVKGTLRLSGSTSGYVGFAPAAAAGSVTYTLPSADGTSGYQLTTNGSGTLSWAAAGSGGSSGWGLTGNSGTGSSNYIGTSDGQPVIIKVNATQAGYLGTTSTYTTTLGISATAAYQSTAIGASANANSSNQATALGYSATAGGYRSVAIGASATTSTSQNETIAVGYNASATSYRGIAVGSGAAASTNNDNIAIGVGTNTTGYQALSVGNGASASANNSTAIGNNASASANNSTAIGNNASASASNSTAIGNGASVSTANYISIGNTSVSAIRGQVNFTTYSDGRFKRNIKEDVHGLDFIMKLRPVTYNWDIHKFNAHAKGGDYKIINAAYNPSEEEAIRKKESITYTGFIAQEVDKAAQDCNYNFSGVLKPVDDKDAYSVTYAEFVVPLVKAAQELNSKVAEQQKMIDALQKELQELKKKVH